MKVVSNTSPLLNLALIGELPLLQRLFYKIVVPEAVRSELEAHFTGADMGVRSPLPQWIETQPVGREYKVFPVDGAFPVWLRDNRRLLFRGGGNGGKILLLDAETGNFHDVLSLD